MSGEPATRDAFERGDFQPKLIYLARRNPALSRAAFTARWRRHGALGMSLPRWRNIARYVHCDVLETGDATAGLATSYDAVGLIWHRSPAARAAHVADTGSRLAMERDELETFAAPIVDCCLLARETVFGQPPAGVGAPLKLIRFLAAARHAEAEALARARLAGADDLRRVLREAGSEPVGHVVNVPLAPERGPRWGLAADCIEELWFADATHALGAARALESAAAAERGREGVEAASISVLTNEVVLYEG